MLRPLQKPRRLAPGRDVATPSRGTIKKAGNCLSEPRHAWWRDLFALPGVNASSEFQPSYFKSTEDSIELATNSMYSNTSGVSLKREPSNHLEWAIQVRSSQCAWIRDHRALTRPNTQSEKIKTKRKFYGLDIAPSHTVRNWQAALRDEDWMAVPPTDWQEKKMMRKRKEWNLQRLKSYQCQWRQKHENWERRKLEKTSQFNDCAEVSLQDLESCERFRDEMEALSNIGQLPSLKLQSESKQSSRITTPRISIGNDGSDEGSPNHTGLLSLDSPSSPNFSEACDETHGHWTDPYCMMDDIKLASHASSASVSPTGMSLQWSSERRGTDDMTQATAQPTIDEEENSRVVSRSRTKTLKLRKAPTIESWEPWRTEYSLEALNSLADFYEACEVDPYGKRQVNLVSLEAMTSFLFGLPPEATACIGKEGQARKLLPIGSLSEYAEMRFSSLPDLLGLIQGSIERVEELDAFLLWAEEDINQLRSIFNHHVHVNDTMPMAQLFQAIDDIGFAQLECKDADSQRWLIGVIHKIFSRPKRLESSMKSAITFEDFVRIVTAALKAKVREPRHEEFKAEQHARHEAGFLPWEMEDLRELHEVYLSMQSKGTSSTFAQLLHFFQACGVRDLDKKEIVQLKRIIEPYANSDNCTSTDYTSSSTQPQPLGENISAPFPVFMLWMREIFELQIGGLTLDTNNADSSFTPPPLEKKGFAFAMLREQARVDGIFSPAVAQESNETMTSPSRRVSSSVPTERRKSMYSLAASHHASRKFKKSATSATPLMTPRHSARSSQEITIAENAGSRKQRSPRSRESRTNSRSNSTSRATSVRNSILDESKRDKGDENAVLQLKGLPSQEAILARKHFRATSVDLSSGITDTKAEPQPEKIGDEKGLANNEARNEIFGKSKTNAKTALASRTVKQGVDTELVVSGALAKLKALGDSSESVDSP